MELAGVSLRYHRSGPWVLRGITCAVGPGEAVLVTGRNGAGKSTLLQVVAGLLPLSRGAVLNRPRVVGWVPERFPVRQPFTARNYLAAIARVRGLGAPEARTAIERWSDRLALTPYLNTRLAELSKGSAQKVGIVQALLVRPELLVLDEPWEGLDAQARAELPSIIADVTKAGGRCVFSDHHGDAGYLPGVRRWALDDGLLTEPETVAAGRHVIELVVPAAESAQAISRLRGEGYEVRSIRRERPRPPRPEGGRPDGGRSDGGRPDGGRPDGTHPEHSRPEHARPEHARPEHARPGQAQRPPGAAQRPAGPPQRPGGPAPASPHARIQEAARQSATQSASGVEGRPASTAGPASASASASASAKSPASPPDPASTPGPAPADSAGRPVAAGGPAAASEAPAGGPDEPAAPMGAGAAAATQADPPKDAGRTSETVS